MCRTKGLPTLKSLAVERVPVWACFCSLLTWVNYFRAYWGNFCSFWGSPVGLTKVHVKGCEYFTHYRRAGASG